MTRNIVSFFNPTQRHRNVSILSFPSSLLLSSLWWWLFGFIICLIQFEISFVHAGSSSTTIPWTSSSLSSSSHYNNNNHNNNNNNNNNQNNDISMGTTLVALKFQNGIVVAADTRTSVSGYVSNKFAKKINIILPGHCVLCRSGSAADTQWLAREAIREFYISRRWKSSSSSSSSSSISQIAHYLRYLVRHSNAPLQASLICAGVDYDDNNDGTSSGSSHIFAITPGGSLLEEELVCVSGSGSTYILGLLDSLTTSASTSSSDSTKKSLLSYTKEEAVELITKLLHISMSRDGSSGGIVRIMIITKENGIEERTVYPSTSSTTTRKNTTRMLKEGGDDNDEHDNDHPEPKESLPGFANPIN